MEALLGTPVSAGFVARALARLAQRLQAAGFDAAMKDALQAEDVLCGDETPANVITKDTAGHGETVPGAPHAMTLRTPDARLIWYADTASAPPTPSTPPSPANPGYRCPSPPDITDPHP
jgi:Transposase IS66 family